MNATLPTRPRRKLGFYLCTGDGIDPLGFSFDPGSPPACPGCFSCIPPTRAEILTRMDKEYVCLARMSEGYDENGFVDYCGDPEADPYSNLCTEHGGHGFWRDLDRVRYDITRMHPV